MNPFRAIKALVTRVRGAALRFSGWGSGLMGRLRYLLPGTRIDFEREAGDLWNHSAVAVCLRWITTNGREPTPWIERLAGKEWEPVPGHEAAGLLNEPNEWYDWATLVSGVLVDLCSTGNAYVRGVRNNMGVPVELWYVPEWAIAPTWPNDGSRFIDGWEYQTDRNHYWIGVDDPTNFVIHIRDGIDPRNERYGLSPLKAQLREIVGDTAYATMRAALAKNLGVPTWAISPAGDEGQFGEATVERIKEWFLGSTTGDEAGKPLVTSDPATYTRLGFSPDEMAVERVVKIPESRICGALGIPPQVVGLVSGEDRKTYENYKTAREAAYDDCLEPLWSLVLSALTRQLLWGIYGLDRTHRIGLDKTRVKAYQADAREIAEANEVAIRSGQMTPNEGRARLDLPPDPDGDVLLVAGTLRPLEQAVEPPEPAPAPPGRDGVPAANGDRFKADDPWRYL